MCKSVGSVNYILIGEHGIQDDPPQRLYSAVYQSPKSQKNTSARNHSCRQASVHVAHICAR